MSEALQALYAGDVEKARELLPADEELTVRDDAAFGRLERLRTILIENALNANACSEDASRRSTWPSSPSRRRRPGS